MCSATIAPPLHEADSLAFRVRRPIAAVDDTTGHVRSIPPGALIHVPSTAPQTGFVHVLWATTPLSVLSSTLLARAERA